MNEREIENLKVVYIQGGKIKNFEKLESSVLEEIDAGGNTDFSNFDALSFWKCPNLR
mgnify:CR=1 FL=1